VEASEEKGKIAFFDGTSKMNVPNLLFEKCIELAKSQLGKIKHMTSLFRKDDRYITRVTYKFKNEKWETNSRLILKTNTVPEL
jgi:hypothetical protein